VVRSKERAPGVRVKHWCNGNSIKMYEKGALLLRVETTIVTAKGHLLTAALFAARQANIKQLLAPAA
jgi:hypothetical protein